MRWLRLQVLWAQHLFKERYYGDLIGWTSIIFFVGWIIYGVVK